MSSLRFEPAAKTRPKTCYNIGATFDIPTTTITMGMRGETIMNGGLSDITVICGAGNNYKSTISHYMMLSAGNTVAATHSTHMNTYDTEVNISLDRLQGFATDHKYLPNDLVTSEDGMWHVTDKELVSANKWAASLNEFINAKIKNKSLITTFTGIRDPYTREPMRQLIPNFTEVDSISAAEADSTSAVLEKDLDDSKSNTYAMKQGLFKSKFLSQLPRLCGAGNNYMIMTAHIGEKLDMATGPAKYIIPSKKLQYLKEGDKIKGISPNAYYLIKNFWFAHTAKLLKNQGTKLAEYPLDDSGVLTDLNLVQMTQLRSKHGPSGYTLPIVVSQELGVMPALTEFHSIKTNGKFGLSGNDINYVLDLFPEVKLSRTVIRRKLDACPLLRKAIQLTSDMEQLFRFKPGYVRAFGLKCTPAELYKDIEALGYDWNELLQTRSWHAIDQYNKDIPNFLSIADLLRMRKGLYRPYWMKVKPKELKNAA